MSFKKLLDELETLSKAFPADGKEGDGAGTGDEDDEKIKAAADGDADDDGTKDGEDADTTGADTTGEDADDDDEDAGDEAELGKAHAVTLESGEVVHAVDGTELVKTLIARTNANEKTLEKALTTSLSTIKGMSNLVKAQGAQIAALQADIARIGGTGKGRKSTVSVMEKGGAGDGKKADEGIAPAEFMAKALTVMRNGALSPGDVSLAEACLNRGQAVPERIINTVMAA